jgi:type VI secretion system protein ImpB
VAIQDELPQSRITLKHRTNIDGEQQDVSLPLRTMILGDFSQGSSQDRQETLEDRRLRSLDGTNRVDDLMEDMDIALQVTAPNKIDPDSDDVVATLPITSMMASALLHLGPHCARCAVW